MKINSIIICLIASFFQSFASTYIMKMQIGEKSISKIIKYNIFMFIYFIIVFFFIPNQLRLISFLSVLYIASSMIFSKKERNYLLYSFNTTLLLSVSEIIVSIALVVFGINSIDIVTTPEYNLLANILISILSVVIFIIPFIRKFFDSVKKLVNKNKKVFLKLFIILITVYLIIAKNGLEFVLKSNYYINILFILSIVIIFTHIMKNELKYNKIEDENKMMLNYVTKYEKIITDQGKRNHEFKNQLMVIRGYAQMNSSKLIEYIDSLTTDLNRGQSSFLISQLNKFPDGGIKGLLYHKLSSMEDYKIKYEIFVEKGVKTSLNKLKISDYVNITKILGVLLDNAIEASNMSDDKKIIVDVKKEKGNVNFKICNTYNGKVDISKVGTGYTTKGKNRGYGLRLVQDIISNKSYLSLDNAIENNYYVALFRINVSKVKNTK